MLECHIQSHCKTILQFALLGIIFTTLIGLLNVGVSMLSLVSINNKHYSDFTTVRTVFKRNIEILLKLIESTFVK